MVACVCHSTRTTPFKSSPMGPTRTQISFVSLFLACPQREELNTSTTDSISPARHWFHGVSILCAVQKINSSVFMAAVMQCSFFSALQLHSHSHLPSLEHGRYWMEKIRHIFSAQEDCWHGPCFEVLAAVNEWESLGWVGREGICMG